MFTLQSDENLIDITDSKNVKLTLEMPVYEMGTKQYLDIKVNTEESPFLFLDMVKTIQGTHFRTYANIEDISVKLDYNKEGFLSNILSSISNLRVSEVLDFLKKSFTDEIKVYKKCWCQKSKRKVSCTSGGKCSEEEGKKEPVFAPKGWWNNFLPKDNYDWPNIYNFAEDFFLKINEDRQSVFEQSIRNGDMRVLTTNEYLVSGFGMYNYQLNCRPTVVDLLRERFLESGPNLSVSEMNAYIEYIYAELKGWYTGGTTGTIHTVYMDEKTIETLMNLNKVDLWSNFLLQEASIRSIFGPPWTSPSGDVRYYGYAIVDGSPVVERSSEAEGPAKNGRGGNLNEYIFIEDPYFESKPDGYWEQEIDDLDTVDKDKLNNGGLGYIWSILSILQSSGKIGGKTIFNYGEGNEHKIHSGFKDFLKKEKLTVAGFLEKIPEITDSTLVRMNGHNSVQREVDPASIVEFYDKQHVSPLDNISAYVPILVGGSYTLTISKKTEDANGNETISVVRSVAVHGNIFQVDFNKDEFVSKMMCQGPYYFVGNYMKLVVDIEFKESPIEANRYSLRTFTEDLTITKDKVLEYTHV